MREVTARVEPLLSCSLCGAIRATAGVKGAVPMVHGPMSCASGHRGIPLQGNAEPLVPPTALTDIDIVRGTSKYLQDAVRKLYQVRSPPLTVVILTCATSLISEDYQRIVRDLTQELHSPVILVDGSAIAGDEIDGYRRFVRALTQTVVPPASAEDAPAGGLTLRGLAGTDFGISAELPILTEMVRDSLGLEVRGSLFLQFDLQKDMPLLSLPGIPVGWLWTEAEVWQPAPYGAEGTRRWLSGIAEAMGSQPELNARSGWVEAQEALSSWRTKLQGMRVAIEALSWWAVGLGLFLQKELGCQVLLSTDRYGLEYQHRYGEFADTTLVDVGNFELLTYLDDFQPSFVFGSSFVKSGPWQWIPFHQPIWHETTESPGWMGPAGAVRLATILAQGEALYA